MSLVEGANSVMGKGKLSRVGGARLIGATAARATSYAYLAQPVGTMFTQLVLSAFGEDDEDEMQKALDSVNPNTEEGQASLIRSSIGALLMLSARRAGNVTTSPFNVAVEVLNKKYGYDLGLRTTEGYNFGDDVVFSVIPPSYEGSKPKTPEEEALAVALALSASSKPFLSSIIGTYKATESYLKTADGMKEDVFIYNIKKKDLEEQMKTSPDPDILQIKLNEETKKIEKTIEVEASKLDTHKNKLAKEVFSLVNASVGVPGGRDIIRFLTENYVRVYRNEKSKDPDYIKKYKESIDAANEFLKNNPDNKYDYQVMIEVAEMKKDKAIEKLEAEKEMKKKFESLSVEEEKEIDKIINDWKEANKTK